MKRYPRIAGIRALVRVRRFEPAHKHANVYRCSAELAPMVEPSLLGCGQAAIGKRSKFRSMKSVRHAEQTSLRAFDCLGNSEQVRNSFVASKLAPTKSSNGGSELARDNTCSDLPLPFNQWAHRGFEWVILGAISCQNPCNQAIFRLRERDRFLL